MSQQSIALHFSKADAAAKFAALDWLVREGIHWSCRAHLYTMAFAFKSCKPANSGYTCGHILLSVCFS